MAFAIAALAVLPSAAVAAGSGGVGTGGGTTSDPTTTTSTGSKAKLLKSGLATAPADAPPEVQAAIEAANRIDDAGYCTGGGHAKWNSKCYDCSGAVSYVLGPKGAGVLKSPLPSGDFNTWGKRGLGEWMTVYYNGGHAFIAIAGLRFDTSTPDDGAEGPGWGKRIQDGMVNGPFKKRHFRGL
jgi:hypothetical protein